ncbi:MULTISPECIES: DUF84 family protein [Shouchella]|uniref:inosine/xanthosine triphosphatase n=2 Tax=Shouchella TaxID=2893057 RepID=A0ABY7W9U7_9BACI|nr:MULTISPECIES: DUF84 family protein [Shouchella]MED4130190.1 DUF84 family protein [Shouchella miscanthi]WDF04256.1 DUF84 family protein [Shouchella hunanensis]GAF21227.1 inosine/xanthosine triphosphatase [Bacillus sp. JCM 19047]
MITLAVGTKNPAKVFAVKETLLKEPIKIETVSAPSGVSAQPFSNEETKLGALNRAQFAREQADADAGIGLEGGVYLYEGVYYLCNWGVMVTKGGHVYAASGLSLPLPKEYNKGLEAGKELSHIIGNDIGKKDGAIGLLTNGRITRKQMFAHIVESCYGMFQFNQ